MRCLRSSQWRHLGIRMRCAVLGGKLWIEDETEVSLYQAVRNSEPTALSKDPPLTRYDLAPPQNESWPMGEGPLVVRAATEEIYQKVQRKILHGETPRHIVIVGNPGLGKSWALCYMLRQVLRAGTKSVYMKRSKQSWFFDHISQKAYEFVPTPQFFMALGMLQQPDVIYLHDVFEEDMPKHLDDVPTVVTSSIARWSEVRNQLKGSTLFVTPWTEAELLAARSVLFPKLSAADVIQRFHVVGGIPRVIALHADPYEAYLDELDYAIATVPLEHLAIASARSQLGMTSDMIMYTVKANEVRALSDWILKRVLEQAATRMEITTATYCSVFQRLMTGQKPPAVVEGFAFDGMFHINMLSPKVIYDFAPLAKHVGGPGTRATECLFPAKDASSTYGGLVPTPFWFDPEVGALQQKRDLVAGGYYRPLGTNLAALDSFLCVRPPTASGANDAAIVAFQLTGAKEKDRVSAIDIHRLLEAIRNNFGLDLTKCQDFQLIFVTPEGRTVAPQGIDLTKDSDGHHTLTQQEIAAAQRFWESIEQFSFEVPKTP